MPALLINRSKMICSLVKGMNRSLTHTIGRSARLAVTMPIPTAKFSSSSVIGSDMVAQVEDRVDEDLHKQLLTRYNLAAMDTHQVFIIQPFKRDNFGAPEDPDIGLKMDESVALADTLGWKVVDKEVVGLPDFNQPEV